MNPLAELETEPWAFDFHAALRRLDCAYPDRPQSGHAARPAEEPVRVGQDPSLTFAPAPIQSFRLPTAERSGRLRVAFLGLFGTQGPLPLHLTEHARDRMRGVGDRTFAAFVDMFHHRMFMLFHRAWAASQPTVGQDRPDSNPFARYLGALCGLGSPSLLGRDPIPDHAKLQFVGLLMQPGRNASGLRSMLQVYFGLPCTIEEFSEDWLELPPENRWRLGYSADVSQLGKTSIMGRKVYQRAHKFRLVLGPLDRPDYDSLLPNKERLKTLAHLVRSYIGDELKWDVKLVLKPQQRRQLALGRGSRMGYDTWLGY
ncbi:MAG TPA: type VI secretion system baseplate subunit TssG, partial [Polyangiaceae bacterium]|nr:type VI secretion system baseplate subunit TssG [Polyangiaceae bacterium]